MHGVTGQGPTAHGLLRGDRSRRDCRRGSGRARVAGQDPAAEGVLGRHCPRPVAGQAPAAQETLDRARPRASYRTGAVRPRVAGLKPSVHGRVRMEPSVRGLLNQGRPRRASSLPAGALGGGSRPWFPGRRLPDVAPGPPLDSSGHARPTRSVRRVPCAEDVRVPTLVLWGLRVGSAAGDRAARAAACRRTGWRRSDTSGSCWNRT